MTHRVAAIGLDAAEWTVIEALMQQGELPNIAALRGRSTEVELHNDLVATGLVWQAFVTGRTPPASAIEFDPRTYEVVQSPADEEPPAFTRAGLRTIAFDVPQMSLGGRGDGLRVTSWGAHGSAYPRTSEPAGLLEEIDRRFGPHPAYEDDRCRWNDPASVRDLEGRLIEGLRKRATIARFLLDEEPEWELFLTVLSETHSAGESFWHGYADDHILSSIPAAAEADRAFRSVYAAVDETVGEIVAAMPHDATVVVFAIHGMKENTGDLPSAYLLPELLYRLETGRPFLAEPDPGWWDRADKPPVVPAVGEWPPVARKRLSSETAGGLVKRGVRTLLPDAVERALIHKVEERREGRRQTGDGSAAPLSLAAHTPYLYRNKWPEMRAFALPTFADGRVRLNLIGREGAGKVEPSRYAETRKGIEDVLSACKDPRNGGSVIEEIVAYTGDPATLQSHDSDLRIVWKANVDALEHPTAGRIGPFRFGRTGGHTERGFALIATPRGTSARLDPRPARDLLPTLLRLAGARVPDEVEGSALETLDVLSG